MESIDWNSVGVIAGILGLVGTIISLCLAIYYANRTKRPNQLKYIPGEFFNVYKTLLSDKFNLEIKYAGTPINNSIYYISGELIVDRDIKTEDNAISIELPEGCKWIGTDKEPSHPDIHAEFEKDKKIPNKAILTFDKIRREDNIIINGIIEGYQLSTDFQSKIKFESRIDDTDNVKVIDFEALIEKRLLILCILIIFVMLCISFAPFYLTSKLLFFLLCLNSIGLFMLIRKSFYKIKKSYEYRNMSPFKRWFIKNISLVGIWLIIALIIYELLIWIIPTLSTLL